MLGVLISGFWVYHCTTAGTFDSRQTNLQVCMGFW